MKQQRCASAQQCCACLCWKLEMVKTKAFSFDHGIANYILEIACSFIKNNQYSFLSFNKKENNTWIYKLALLTFRIRSPGHVCLLFLQLTPGTLQLPLNSNILPPVLNNPNSLVISQSTMPGVKDFIIKSDWIWLNMAHAFQNGLHDRFKWTH